MSMLEVKGLVASIAFVTPNNSGLAAQQISALINYSNSNKASNFLQNPIFRYNDSHYNLLIVKVECCFGLIL